MYFIYIVVIALVGIILGSLVFDIVRVFSEEPKYDRVFDTPHYNGVVYQTVVNGTVYETTNNRQIVFYYWSDLSENAKRIVNQTMVLNGYTESERSLHFD